MAPQCTMAPAERAEIPTPVSTPAKVCDATVEPAVVEAVAAAIKIPETGASRNVGRFIIWSQPSTSEGREEALIMPAMAPVPNNRMETPITLFNPNSAYFKNCFV